MRYRCDRCGRQNRRQGDSVCDDCIKAMAGLAMAKQTPGWQALLKEAGRREWRSPDGLTFRLWLFLGLPCLTALIIFNPSAIDSLAKLLPDPHPNAAPIQYYMVYGGLILAAYFIIWVLVRVGVLVLDR